MTERVQVGGLQVAKVLYDFVNQEAIPGTGVERRSVLVRFRGYRQRSGPP